MTSLRRAARTAATWLTVYAVPVLVSLVLVAAMLMVWLPDGIGQDLSLLTCGLFAGAILARAIRRDVDATNLRTEPGVEALAANARRDAHLLPERLTIAARAAGNELWEMDLSSGQRVWIENHLPSLGLQHVAVEHYAGALAAAMHCDDGELVRNTVHQAIESNGSGCAYRFRIVGPDGATRHFQDSVTVVRNAAGVARGLIGATTDVTNEVQMMAQAQQQAEESRVLNDRLSVVVTAAGMEVWEYDLRSSKFLFVQNRMSVLGMRDTPIEEFDAALQAVVPEEDRQRYFAIIEAAVRGGEQFCTYGFRIVRAGATYHMRCYASIVRDSKGRPLRLLGATADVTNELKTTELLQNQAEQQRALVDRLNVATRAAGIASWELDLKTSRFLWRENWRVTKSEGEASVEVLETLVHPEDKDHFLHALQKARETGSDLIAYRHRILSDGRVLHMQNHARLFRNSRGNPVRALGVTWDVSNEVAATELIQQQAQAQQKLLVRLSVATQAAGIMCWELDFKTQKIVWHENFSEEFVAAANGELLAELQRRTHPDDRDAFNDGLREALRNKSDLMTYRYRASTPEGQQIHRQCCARLLFDADGKLTHALGVTCDITKEVDAVAASRQQAEYLAEVERRLERASLSSSEGHFEWDLVSGKAWYSSSSHALLGYRAGEIPGDAEASVRLLQRPEDAHWQDEKYAAHIAQGTAFDYETQLRTGSGELRWFRIRGTAERDANGNPLIMAGSLHDIHQQKLIEDVLEHVQQRFERAIHGTQDGLWELDADGTAWLSPRLAELLGHTAQELPNDVNFMTEFLHPDDVATVASAKQMHFEQALPYDVEIRLRTRTGGYRWYRARASAERHSDGRPTRLSGSLQDVTEARKAREELLHAITAAENANRAKSAFLANVSHEIRTPMNGIIGMTGLMLDTALDRTQREYADTIRSSADSLLTVINDILDFSKIEAGKLDIEQLEIDLRGNVEDVGTMMAWQAAAKHLELIVHVHADVPARCSGDPQRIRQCLINLVGNAIKFTRSGEVLIEVRTLESGQGVPLVQFEVHDTGIGIAPEKLHTLFQPFVQADSSTTRHFGGTGLGLSIVRRLVGMMGGETGVNSELGKGSCFWFRLPLTAIGDTRQDLRVAHGARRVLVVDDNASSRRALAAQLTGAGYEISVASSGAEAMAQLRVGQEAGKAFDAMVCDFQMPDMDGAKLSGLVMNDVRWSHTRMIMLTSLDRHSDLSRIATLGFAGHLSKPVRSRELFECLERVLADNGPESHTRAQRQQVRGGPRQISQTKRFAGRVLLVEDNLVNQKVAARFLERLGCTVQVADNGAVAVAAYERDDFAMVLMDLQMPVMDGFTATLRIRELAHGRRRLPIVALTANAMAGQLEQCLAAGMDGFLSKPIEAARLEETLDRFGLAIGSNPLETTATTVAGEAALDGASASITSGNTALACFAASSEQLLGELSSTLAAMDRAALARAAHKLCIASTGIQADVLCELLTALQSEAPSASATRLRELRDKVARECRRAQEVLSDTARYPIQVVR